MNQSGMPVVLTIDDDQFVRESLANFLEDFGYTVLQAADGLQGLELLAAHRPDLILVDLRMPRMDGLQVLAKVQEVAPEIPIMVVSGAGDIRDVVEALRRGAWDYLVKPIQDMNILLHSVQNCLERARLP